MFIWLVSPSTKCVEAAEQPNIMVFLVDDMGVMDTSVPFLTDETGRRHQCWIHASVWFSHRLGGTNQSARERTQSKASL
ncbi:hypothetical protein OAA27_02270 [bacterium]|nr:hypothetical protein [bacterium]